MGKNNFEILLFLYKPYSTKLYSEKLPDLNDGF